MTPIQTATELYKGKQGDFMTDLAVHLRVGVVYSGPDAFMMGRAVCWAMDDLMNPSLPSRGAADTWFIWMTVGVGAVRKALQLCPYPLKYVAWERHHDQGRVRRYTFERVMNLGGHSHGKLT